MFKKFKDKLAEEMKQSPARLQAGMQQLAQAVVSPSLSNTSIQDLSSKDNFSLTEETDETPKNSPAKHGFQTIDLTPPSINSSNSRRSSISSNVSDASFLFPIYESPQSMYHLQSDMDQSASEIDDNISPQFDRVSKEQLYSAYRKARAKYDKYKGRFSDLVTHYREMERAKTKLESLLVETQDKALRRISDLKEQCQLEQQAKAHLEEALRNDIEEKDHVINSLRTKIKLIQEKGEKTGHIEHGQENHIENDKVEVLVDLSTNAEEQESKESKLLAENDQLKEKIQKIETFLEKYKDMLKRSKEKIQELTNEKNTMERDYDLLQKSSKEKFDAVENELFTTQGELTTLKNEIDVLKKREEESVISLAENKLSIHRELEGKEEQIKQLQLELKQMMDHEKSLKESLEIQKQEIEKVRLVASQNAEASEEHLRGKSEALQKLQAEMEQKFKEPQENIEAKYNEEVSKNKDLQEKIESLEQEYEKINNESAAVEQLTHNLAEQQNLLVESDAAKKEFEILAENYKKQNEALEGDLKKLKSDLDANIYTLKCKYEEEINELRVSLKEKNDICNISNLKIQEYTEEHKEFKQKLQTQENEIQFLKSLPTEEEKLFRLQDEIENKNIEILGLTSELKSRSTTITDLKKEINNLVNSKKSLLKTLKLCKKRIKVIKQDYTSLRNNVNNYMSDGKSEIFENIDKTVQLFSSLSEKNLNLQSQISDLNKNTEIIIELQKKCDDQSSLLRKALEEKQYLEKELENKCSTIENMELQLNNLNELKVDNNQSLIEIGNLQNKISELEELCYKNDKLLNETTIEKAKLLQELNLEQQKHKATLQKLSLEISNGDTKSKELFDITQKYKEVICEIQTLKSVIENKEKLETQLQTVMFEFNTAREELKEKTKQLESFQSDNIQIEEKLRCNTENYNKELEEYNLKISTYNEELTVSKENCKKLEIELKETQDSVRKITDSKNTLIQKLKSFKEKLQKTIDERKHLTNELEQEKVKSKSFIDELNQSLSIRIKENEELKINNSKLETELGNLQISKSEIDSLINEKTNITRELNELKSQNDLLKNENKNMKDNQDDLLKLNEVLKQSQTELTKKISALENKNSNIINENDNIIKELENLRNQLQNTYAEMETLKIHLAELDEVKDKNIQLSETLQEANQYQHKNLELINEIQSLKEANDSLISEAERLKSNVINLEKNFMENKHLTEELEVYKNQVIEHESQSSLKIEKLHSLCKNFEDKINDLTLQLEEKDNAMKQMEFKNSEFIEQINSLSSTIQNLQDKIQISNSLSQELENSNKTLVSKELELTMLREQCSNQKEEIVNINNQNLKDTELAKNYENAVMDKRKLESQLDETLITFQAKEMQMQAINEELRNQETKLREQLKTNEEEQSLRLKQIVKEFKAQLQDKEKELQAALDKRFDYKQNYESDTILEYKEQLKDFQIELTKKSEQIEKLLLDNENTRKQAQEEIEKFFAQINQMKSEHAKEVEDINEHWKNIVKQKTNQMENKHDQEISKLSNEWHNERKNVEYNDLVDKELENTTRVAMATVQSNTGSFHTLQQTLLAQKKELAELRKIVKMRQESVEDSTEIEYLRNILFKYMMGKETMVLAKVIAAVVKFDQEQTSKILKKEEDKQSLLGSLGFT